MLPEQIPVHFDAQGVVDGYGSPLTIFLLPALILGTCILAEVMKHLDPKHASYALFSKHYYQFFIVLDLFFFLIQLYLISYSMEWITVNISNLMIVAMGLLFLFMGNMMPKVKHNYFMGIKTAWTLASEQVWYDTHRFSGKLWFVLGILICISGFLPPKIVMSVFLICTGVAVLVPFVYSYVIFKKLGEETDQG